MIKGYHHFLQSLLRISIANIIVSVVNNTHCSPKKIPPCPAVQITMDKI